MDIVVALDGPRQRNLRLYAGDEQTLTLYVFEHDGDTAPITATDPRIVTQCWPGSVTIPVATQFTVPDSIGPRTRYRLIAEIGGVTTTLAYGVLLIDGAQRCCGWDYGWWWPA